MGDTATGCAALLKEALRECRLSETVTELEIAEEDQLRAQWYALLGRFLSAPPDAATRAVARALVGDETDLGQGVKALAAAAKTSDVKAPLGVFPWNTWQSLIEIAMRTVPEKQTKMVEFVIQLEKKRMDDAETGEQMRHEGELLWTGLPALGYTVADAWQEFGKSQSSTHASPRS